VRSFLLSFSASRLQTDFSPSVHRPTQPATPLPTPLVNLALFSRCVFLYSFTAQSIPRADIQSFSSSLTDSHLPRRRHPNSSSHSRRPAIFSLPLRHSLVLNPLQDSHGVGRRWFGNRRNRRLLNCPSLTLSSPNSSSFQESPYVSHLAFNVSCFFSPNIHAFPVPHPHTLSRHVQVLLHSLFLFPSLATYRLSLFSSFLNPLTPHVL